jgi:LysM repeat protein
MNEPDLAAIDLVIGADDVDDLPATVAVTLPAAAPDEWMSLPALTAEPVQAADPEEQATIAEAAPSEEGGLAAAAESLAESRSVERVAPAAPVLVLAQAAAPAAPEMLVSHTVVRGETLSGLARRFGTSVEAIRQLNGLGSDDLLRVGQRLRVPRDVGPVHLVQAGETLWGIARRYHVQQNSIAAANALSGDRVLAGQRLFVPGGVQPEPTDPPTPEGALANQTVQQTPTARPTSTPKPSPSPTPAKTKPKRP